MKKEYFIYAGVGVAVIGVIYYVSKTAGSSSADSQDSTPSYEGVTPSVGGVGSLLNGGNSNTVSPGISSVTTPAPVTTQNDAPVQSSATNPASAGAFLDASGNWQFPHLADDPALLLSKNLSNAPDAIAARDAASKLPPVLTSSGGGNNDAPAQSFSSVSSVAPPVRTSSGGGNNDAPPVSFKSMIVGKKKVM